jgi:hypothetical protein
MSAMLLFLSTEVGIVNPLLGIVFRESNLRMECLLKIHHFFGTMEVEKDGQMDSDQSALLLTNVHNPHVFTSPLIPLGRSFG